ncbi:MAG TPA: class I SAM-dependent methyltransferase [Candidatus Limnocylindria bacterium]|nr:class I SAM-dependent methyltransferase [Candidatus Limnocylindria bacterium]
MGQARDTARRAGIANCTFVEGNLLDIPTSFHGRFDFVFFTVGALTWFEDLGPVFRKAADCMKPGGALLIHDIHPYMSMLPAPGEEAFDPQRLDRFTYPYFRKAPWLETDGMGYIAGTYQSKLFTSFSHTVSHLLTRLMESGFALTKFLEFDTDVGLTDVYDGKGLPLSYLLTARLERKGPSPA